MHNSMAGSTQPLPTWEVRAKEKRKQCAKAIPPSWQLPTHILDTLKLPLETNKNNLISLDIPRRSRIPNEIELSITESFTTGELIEKLATGAFTAIQVVTAFSKRASTAQQLACYIHHPIEKLS
ncbi:hypothetical protein ACKLNR_007282 [Fusarium oxysporum f. sp. zingiberi]